MNLLIALIVLALVCAPSSSIAQSTLRIGAGGQVENVSNVVFQALASSNIQGPRALLQYRREVYASSKLFGTRGSLAVLGAGYGLQWERSAESVRPYFYTVPTLSLLSDEGRSSELAVGLGGGIGLIAPMLGHEYFGELSWRGHGIPLDGAAYGVITFGRTFSVK